MFLLKPTDIPCFVKKKISKLYLNPKILPDQEIPPKPLGRKFLKALHDNDQKLAYYYGFKTIKTIYNGYEEHAEHFLSQIPHQKIYTNLLTVDEVLSVLKQIEENIDLPINVNDQALNFILLPVFFISLTIYEWIRFLQEITPTLKSISLLASMAIIV